MTTAHEVLALLRVLPEFQAANVISVYLSMPSGELSTSSVVREAFRQKKRIFVPFIAPVNDPSPDAPKSVMDMVSLHSEEDYQNLEPDRWGIPTPSPSSIDQRVRCLGDDDLILKSFENNVMETEHVDLILMPGMAFDQRLARLGHGKGFYDFFLQRYQKRTDASKKGGEKMPFLIGLALQEQVLPESQHVPTGALDWPLDALVVGDGRVLRRDYSYVNSY
ncbi:MAG: hypothetical protein LQ342_003083 [Letrouitia transgressa]|nr:MAG: hypothetical protein LQ342_003083 [Letrouitia transgressa]